MKKLTWMEAIKIAIFAGFASFIIFLMIDVAFSQILLDTLIQMYSANNNLSIFIILAGFLVSFIVCIIASLMSSESVQMKYGIYASILTFVTCMFIWIFVSYAVIMTSYDVLADLTMIECIIVFPRVIAYFAIYVLSNVTVLWLLNVVLYSALFPIFLKILDARKVKKKENLDYF
jgi:hypothetical protein